MPRYLAPSGVPITPIDILNGLWSCLSGSSIRQFRTEICRYFNVKHCFLTSSGRAALSILFQALHQLHPDRNEVVLPAFTSFSVPSAAVNAGLKVALYDLDAQNLSPNIASLQEAITERTLCVVVCHLYGFPCDMNAVLDVAEKRSVPVIDDAAQAMGATYRGRLVGTMGAAGVFSLSRGKNISTVDGGIIVTDSRRLAEQLEMIEPERVGLLKNFGLIGKAFILSAFLHPILYSLPARLPFLNIGSSVFEPAFPIQRFTPFQAGIGRRMLRRLSKINIMRREKAQLFMKNLALHSEFPKIVQRAEPVFLRLPLLGAGGTNDVWPEKGCVGSYPKPLNEIEPLKRMLVNLGTFPVANRLAKTIVTLPTHQFVTRSDMTKITKRIQGPQD